MCLTFLGTGSGTPTRTRNTAATIYARPDRSEFWLSTAARPPNTKCFATAST